MDVLVPNAGCYVEIYEKNRKRKEFKKCIIYERFKNLLQEKKMKILLMRILYWYIYFF